MNYKKTLVKLVKAILGEKGKDKYFGIKLSYYRILNWLESNERTEITTERDCPTVHEIKLKWHMQLSQVFSKEDISYKIAFDNTSFILDCELDLKKVFEILGEEKYKFTNCKGGVIKATDAINCLKKGLKIGVYQTISREGVVLFSDESAIHIYPNSSVEAIDISLFKQYDFDVDVVYTWVDGEEPNWLERKNLALGKKTKPSINSADSDSRFRNRDELMYSIRSLQMYADWVRNIYIVTDSQIPDWIKKHSNIKIVDHKDIFPDESVLPVFNSHAIESCLHRIVGLSENFLYFNDDVFLGKKVEKSDFFYPFGSVSKCFYSNQTYIPSEINSETLPVDIAAINNANFLEEKYGYRPTRKFKHTPIPLKKSVLIELEKMHPEIFTTNRSAKFRSENDYSIVSSLHHHYGILKGKVIASEITYDYINLGDSSYKNKLGTLVFQPDHARKKCFCINDVNSDHLCQKKISDDFVDIMNRLYTFKSKFEI